MKSVRIFYTKTGRMKFVSHLDMNRLMSRVITKSKIPVWYTEGFNQHIYINYAVPLSLGYEGVYEIMDIKMADDNFPLEKIVESLNAVSPDDIEFLKATEPVLQMKDIEFAEYEICFDTEENSFFDALKEFLSRDSIIVQKTTKRGNVKEFDIISKIKKAELSDKKLNVILKAGNEDNVNPSLLLGTFFEQAGIEPVFYTVLRTMIFDCNLKEFA